MGIGLWGVTAALGAVALSAPAGATPAPTVNVDRQCYVNAGSPAPVTVSGKGWTPGDTLELASRDGQLYGTAVVDPAGRFQATLHGAAMGGHTEQTEQLTVTDRGNQATKSPPTGQTAGISFLVTNLLVTTTPAEARLQQKVTFTFSGFRPGRVIFAHYRHRGQPVARQRFGRATGPCGILRARALQYPGGHPQYTSYTVQVDDSARYSKRATPRYVARLSTF